MCTRGPWRCRAGWYHRIAIDRISAARGLPGSLRLSSDPCRPMSCLSSKGSAQSSSLWQALPLLGSSRADPTPRRRLPPASGAHPAPGELARIHGLLQPLIYELADAAALLRPACSGEPSVLLRALVLPGSLESECLVARSLLHGHSCDACCKGAGSASRGVQGFPLRPSLLQAP